jgi:uncharacterized lipoprotein YajG
MKHKKIISSAMLVSTLVLAGCAFNPQQANLSPTVSLMGSSEGRNVEVLVKVTDERPSQSLGRRGTAYGAAAEITTAQNISAIVQKEVVEGLKKKGFAAKENDEGAATTVLTVEIRLLEYSTSQGFWTGGVHIRSAFKAVATRNGKNYEKIYRTDKEERVVVVPSAETNEKWINEALGTVLTQLLNDNGLITFLAE